ncbi:junctional cadherin 5-associated protein [Ctenodactylus gundi]
MYSVEDLLISHGYKPSRHHPVQHEDDPEGRQQVRTRPRASHGLLNGCENGPAAFAHSRTAQGKGHVNDAESRHSTPPRGHGECPRASASRTSEAGFYNQPASAWTSQSHIGNNQAYWRRDQEISNLQGPRDRDDLEVRGMAQAHSLPVHMREGPWDVGRRTEHVMKKAVWEEELRMAGPAKWQNVSLENWNQPKKLGRQMSDGDREKLFQDLYPFIQGEQALISQNKKKSQSLPRVLSPESLNCMEIPIQLNDGHLPSIPKMPPYAPQLESIRNSENAGSTAPFPRPKFGRPLKPPLYGSHQQPKVGEHTDSQDTQQTSLHSSYLTKTSDPRHELSVSDCGLEPPVYVPPPSYRSPPLHIPNPYLEETVPRHVSGSQGPQQHLTEKSGARCPLPSGSLGTGNEYATSPGSPPLGLPSQPRPVTSYEGSVQYIPFDDPRIRHIKLAQPSGFCEEAKLDDRPYDSSPVAPEPAQGKPQHDGGFLNAQGLTPLSETERSLAFADPIPWWLRGPLPGDGENRGFSDQRDHCIVRGPGATGRGGQSGQAGSHISSPDPQGERTCEAQTKLRKFETGIQTKKSSKKKTNETIFCLVSIPVKSEPHLPEIDTNNNDLKQNADKKLGVDKSTALQEQSLLSMSSTDLELQALTGSMAGRAEFPKQDLGEPEGDKQTNDLRFIHLAKHRELKYSGSWPGNQYKDQQTQTSFSEEPSVSQVLPGTKLGGSDNTEPTSECLDPTASDIQGHVPLGSSDQKQKPHHTPNLRSQTSLSPSSHSAFSRTLSSISQAPMPKAGQSQPCVGGHGQRATPGLEPEVVKGEPASGPCNSKQLFGQFLLKPVSRRPWDLISQLESFNKELQEEEESPSSGSGSGSGSEDSGTEQRQEDCADSGQRNRSFREKSQDARAGHQPVMCAPEDPECLPGGVKSKSESWNREPKPGHWHAGAPFPGLLQVVDSRVSPFRSARGSQMVEKRKQENADEMDELAVSPGPLERVLASGPSDTEPVPCSYLSERREPLESQELTDALSSVQLSRRVPLKVDGGEERSPVFPLTLTNKSRGLSAPDLRSVGLTMGEEQDARQLNGPLGEGATTEIPPSESLQERAARILGIEVAVESLLTGTSRPGQNQLPEPDASACSPELPREASLSSSAPLDGSVLTTDAFYGRRKCGWTHSPLFVGERAPHAAEHSGVDQVLSGQATSPELQPSSLDSKSFDQNNMETKPPFRSTLFHFIERTPSVAGSEKRLRSPSKVIESLQEKLASPPRRADPDRLMRMKEVSSVSRMRCLSFRSTDSTEEAEDWKAAKGQAWQPGGPVSLCGGDRAWRVGHPPSLSKSITSLEENGHVASQREKKDMNQDFWCPDSYDPSRVERV